MLAASALVCLVVENSSLLTTLHCIPLALIKPLCIRALQTFVEQPSVYADLILLRRLQSTKYKTTRGSVAKWREDTCGMKWREVFI